MTTGTRTTATNSVLDRIDAQRHQRHWDAALDAIDAAQGAGLRYSAGRTPLDFVRTLVESERSREANARATALLDEAHRALAGQEINRVRELYDEALHTPHIDAALHRQIRAAIERLETQANRPERLDRVLRATADGIDSHTLELLETVSDERPNMARFLRLASVPRWLDEEVLAVMRNHVNDGREAELLERMSRLPFGYAWEDGHYTLSKRARQFFLPQWGQYQEEFQLLNARLAEHFGARLTHDPPRNPAQIQRLTQAKLYHTFLADPPAGVRLMREIFQHAEDTYQVAAARQYIAVLQELEGLIPDPYFAYVDYAEGWFHEIKGNYFAAESIYDELCRRSDLGPGLIARAQRGLAHIRLEMGEWAEASARYRTALATFQAQGDDAAAAETMMDLGNAYLEMATRASDETDPFEPGQPVYNGILAFASFLLRLPLLCYLLWTLALRWPPPNLFRLGRGVDWVIARLYSSSIRWFGRAETHFAQTADRAGLNRTRENLARLYLTLQYPRRAEALLMPLLAEAAAGTYQWARLQLLLADVSLERGRLRGVEAQLQSALSIFGGLGHQRQVAQTQTRLGYLARRLGKPAEAVRAYTAAFHAWHGLDDAAHATDALHAAEQIARQATIPTPAREAIAQAQEQLPERVYTMRYVHPWLGIFQRFGIALFYMVLFVALWSSVRTGTDVQLGADVILQRAVSVEDQAERFRPTVNVTGISSSSATDVVSSQVAVNANMQESRFFINTFVVAPLIYLLWYTVIGLILLNTTRLRSVERQQTRSIRVTAESISTYFGSERQHHVLWAQVRSLLLGNITLSRKPIEFLSSFALTDPEQLLEVPGDSRHYSSLLETALHRIPAKARVRDTGFSVLHSPMGWIFLGSLLTVGIYVGLVFAAREMLDEQLFNTLYRLADLYSLPFVGAGIPLYFWLVVQPVRTYLARRESIALMWTLTGINVLLAGLALWQFWQIQIPLGRPDIVLPVLLLFSVGYTLAIQLRSARFRSRWARITTAVATSLVLAVVGLWLLRQESLAFHHLVRGNAYMMSANKSANKTSANQQNGAAVDAVQWTYADAASAYERSAAFRPVPSVQNSYGYVLSQLGQHADAVDIYQEVLQRRPHNLTYRQNLALTYTEWSGASDLFMVRDERYQATLKEYDEIIRQLSNSVSQSPADAASLRMLRELRAATRFDLAVAYHDEPEYRDQSWALFRESQAEYQTLIDDYGGSPAGYMGRGWTHFFLRHAEANDFDERQRLEDAINDFETALRVDPTHTPAYNGLGWSHFQVSRIIPGNCIAGFDNEDFKPEYVDRIEAAVDAFTRGVSIQDNGWFFRTRAQLQYILGYCGEPYDRETQLRLAIADYERAVQADPRLGWFDVWGRLHIELGNYLADSGGDAQTEYEQAAGVFLDVLSRDPSYGTARDRLRNLYTDKLGRDDAQALDDILAATGRADSSANLLALAEDELQRGKFGLGKLAVERVLAEDPKHGEAAQLLARIMLGWARISGGESRTRRYEAAVQAANLAIANGAGDSKTYLILTHAYNELGRPEMALPLLDATGRMPIDDPRIWYGLGYIYLTLGEDVEAHITYRRGIVLTNSVPDAERRMALFATAIGDALTAPDATPARAASIAMDLAASALVGSDMPLRNAQAHADAGRAAWERAEYARAVPLLLRAVELEPFNQAHWNSFRDALIDGQGKTQVASAQALLALIQGSTGREGVEPLIEVAELELARDVFGLAVAALERALTVEPDNRAVYRLLTEAYTRWGSYWAVDRRHQQAIDTADRAAAAGIADDRILVWKSRAHLALGQTSAAVAAVEEAITLNPQNPDAYSRLGWYTYVSGEYDRSVDASTNAIALRPDDPREYFNRGLAHVARGDADAAQESYAAGIDVANELANAARRTERLNEALDDLGAVRADPLDLAGHLIDLLQTARDAAPPE